MARRRRLAVACAVLAASALPGRGARHDAALSARAGSAEAGGVSWSARRWLSSAALLMGVADSRAQMIQDFEQMDANKDGFVDREEYMVSTRDMLDDATHMKKDMRSMIFEYMRQLWDFSDVDGDGVLSEAEAGFAQFLVAEDAVAMMDGTRQQGEPPDWGRSKAEMHLTMLDKNRDGRVAKDEFAQGWKGSLVDLGLDDGAFAALEQSPWTDAFFAQCDVDGDNTLDTKELQYASYLISQFILEQAASALFAHMDMNTDDSIAKSELAVRLRQHRGDGGRAHKTAEAAYEQFARGDVDGDGRISRRESTAFAAAVLGDLR